MPTSSGSSGVGKTTIARLIAADLAEPWAIEEIDAQDCSLEFVRDMQHSFQYRAMGEKQGKAFIVNEVHNLRSPVLSRFLTLLEPSRPLPAHVCIIFTTTKEGQESLFEDFDAPPLLSRCLEYRLSSKGLADLFAARAHEIADKEGINGKEIVWYKRLAMDKRNNMRAMLSAIEAGEAMS